MSREGTGEESRRQILEVAANLFSEKGYDNTTIMDIVNGLGGMTKGVIYHHFKSKKDIFEQVLESYSDKNSAPSIEGQTGLEKIKSMLLRDLLNIEKQSVGYSARVMLRTPRMIGEQYLMTFDELAPYIEKLVQEGIEDGSIQTDYSREMAELIMVTFNLWMGLQLSKYSTEEAVRKLPFFQELFRKMGADIIDDEVLEAGIALINHLKK